MFDYSKYENATPKQLLHALTLSQKKAERLKQQLKENKEIFKFLQKQLKNSFNTKKTKKIPELDEAIKDYENGNVVTCHSMEEFKIKMAED